MKQSNPQPASVTSAQQPTEPAPTAPPTTDHRAPTPMQPVPAPQTQWQWEGTQPQPQSPATGPSNSGGAEARVSAELALSLPNALASHPEYPELSHGGAASTAMQPVPVTPAAWAGEGPTPHRPPALAGEFKALKNASLFGLADALLKAPANVAYQLNVSGRSVVRLFALVTSCMLMTGFVVASFSGGYQYLAVPVKLSLGLLFGAGLCLPSLYIFSCLSNARHTFRTVAGALLMGLGVQALLLMGFTPIAWIFSQSTSSPEFMGFLYFILLLVSTGFGLALTSRVLAATGQRIGALKLWNLMFVVVLLQLTTNLRPIIGEYEGPQLAEKQFFLGHWFESLAEDR